MNDWPSFVSRKQGTLLNALSRISWRELRIRTNENENLPVANRPLIRQNEEKVAFSQFYNEDLPKLNPSVFYSAHMINQKSAEAVQP